MRLQSSLSEKMVSNTGAPKGTVLSPFLFTRTLVDQRSLISNMLKRPKISAQRHKKSFHPTAVRLYTSSTNCRDLDLCGLG
ncbi:hypothetical protein AAFF_G00003040 [Aldrovandia affinis]|uniref:Uncharacterized protein n=1 Tax=Aldrovandia affinis TaxID=143900 RepID=A0AAD7TD57_9TELE|nr:hypothetical protein AAFF_G00003040 [Aldrovandia affinis]